MTTDIQSALERAATTLSSGQITNETQVSFTVIVPILSALDWNYTNLAELFPEYPVPNYKEGKGRVDFALLRPDGHPLVFIEAKRPNNLKATGVNQLFDYATNQGVPLLILTDGAEWRFFLSMAAGVPDERRFYRAELRGGGNISEIARHFDSYLRKKRVHSGESQRAAEEFHKSAQSKAEAKNTISQVWLSLLQEPDDTLRDLLVEAVEEKCGTRPDLDDVEEFLDNQIQNMMPVQTSDVAVQKRSNAVSPPSRKSNITDIPHKTKRQIVGYTLNGEEFKTGTGRNTLAEILKKFQQRDPNFMSTYAYETQGRTRRLVAQRQEDLYDTEHLLYGNSMQLEDGWWLGTHLSSGNVRKNIITACKIAGVKFGKELTLIESG